MSENAIDLPILIVDDDQQALSMLKSVLECAGIMNVMTFDDSRKALVYLENNDAAVIVLDLMMPNYPGLSVLDQLAKQKPYIPVIIVTAENQIETAIECMKSGAVDYLTKPISINRLIAGIKRALELRGLNDKISSLQNPREPEEAFSPPPQVESIVTTNREMLSLLRYSKVIALSTQPILIFGETGVGKELFAQAVHSMSQRNGTFVSVNVAGLDDMLFSDTLFGHLKGAYTGAMSHRDGLVKKAAGGTLFLDEIGDLNEISQIKLLRLLQENEYYPLGSDGPVQSRARLVVATNQDLKRLMNEGRFRKDLYYRLCTHQITVLPLRNRPDDIPLLLDHFISEAVKLTGKPRPSYRKELVSLLSTYEFPGNVRELQSMVVDGITKSPGKLLVSHFKKIIDRERDSAQGADITAPDGNSGDCHAVTFQRFPSLKESENELIRKAMEIAKGNQGNAAQLLGITRQALNNRLRRNKVAK